MAPEAGGLGRAVRRARGLARVIHPDFLFHIQEDLPNGGDWVGIEGYNRMTRSWLEAWDEFGIEPDEFIPVTRDGILIPVRQRARAHASGLEVEGQFIYVLLFRDEKVEQIHLYADRAQADLAARRDSPAREARESAD